MDEEIKHRPMYMDYPKEPKPEFEELPNEPRFNFNIWDIMKIVAIVFVGIMILVKPFDVSLSGGACPDSVCNDTLSCPTIPACPSINFTTPNFQINSTCPLQICNPNFYCYTNNTSSNSTQYCKDVNLNLNATILGNSSYFTSGIMILESGLYKFNFTDNVTSWTFEVKVNG